MRSRSTIGMYAIAGHAADGLLCGGFHTPNHRWVIASSLMVSADFFGKDEYAKGAEGYLAEGIDCNRRRRIRGAVGGDLQLRQQQRHDRPGNLYREGRIF